MTVWQAVTNDSFELVLCQADSAKNLAEKLNISVKKVYKLRFHHQNSNLKIPGRNKGYKIVKVVIEDD